MGIGPTDGWFNQGLGRDGDGNGGLGGILAAKEAAGEGGGCGCGGAAGVSGCVEGYIDEGQAQSVSDLRPSAVCL